MHGAPLTGRGGCLSELALKISVLSDVISTADLMSAVPYSRRNGDPLYFLTPISHSRRSARPIGVSSSSSTAV